jgi:hypothetical protein
MMLSDQHKRVETSELQLVLVGSYATLENVLYRSIGRCQNLFTESTEDEQSRLWFWATRRHEKLRKARKYPAQPPPHKTTRPQELPKNRDIRVMPLY